MRVAMNFDVFPLPAYSAFEIMPAWTIISPRERDYGHPLRPKIFRIMKTIYHMLHPSHEPSMINEAKHIATLGYAVSQEKPGPPILSSVVIHFRLSTESVTRFAILLHDMQIEDKVHDVRIPIPDELKSDMMDVYDFVSARSQKVVISSHDSDNWAECKLARKVSKQLQVQKYHERLLQQEGDGAVDIIGLRSDSSRCSICDSNLIHCNNCQVASCESHDCRGSSDPPFAQCVRHQMQVLCFPCLQAQGCDLEKCPGCNSWCCARDISSCTGHPVSIPHMRRVPGDKLMSFGLLDAYSESARAHPPKRGSCMECKLPGWRSCQNKLCWSQSICQECTSGGITCPCGEVWACDLCTEHDPSVFIRCPRCDRPFCYNCSYIDECCRCQSSELCHDCAEEASETDTRKLKVLPAKLVVSCGSCELKVCDRCESHMVFSCAVCSSRLCTPCVDATVCSCSRVLCDGCVADHGCSVCSQRHRDDDDESEGL
ncbi:uncharacterized protein EDB91DRAFT_1163201 [Suillus paluster]|uniref:uncharacterized protein n=1 Tax=Suillus paluster TaxID=48578 RepID=UPI001B877E9D|nr:uncharacterized protein EDB91DRAFT_1163201 [Suillus paluster]KAG1727775.1 hypothetical protein EDB91DRAFT_1163201 [Suillus paluster]